MSKLTEILNNEKVYSYSDWFAIKEYETDNGVIGLYGSNASEFAKENVVMFILVDDEIIKFHMFHVDSRNNDDLKYELNHLSTIAKFANAKEIK